LSGTGDVTLHLYLIALWLVWNNGPAQFNCAISFAEMFMSKPDKEEIKNRLGGFLSIALIQLCGSLFGILLTFMSVIEQTRDVNFPG